jgi:hypothetical protein
VSECRTDQGSVTVHRSRSNKQQASSIFALVVKFWSFTCNHGTIACHHLTLPRNRTFYPCARSPPAAPIWECVLQSINYNVMTNVYGDDAVDVTGPGVLAHCAERWGVKVIGYLEHGIGFIARDPPHPVHFVEVNGHIKTRLHGTHYSELWSAKLIYDCPDRE